MLKDNFYVFLCDNLRPQNIFFELLTRPLLARVWSVKFSDLRYKLKTNIHKKFLILILAWKCHNFTKSDRHNLSEWAVESCFVVSFDTEIPLFCFAHSSSADHLSLMSGKVHDLYCSLAVCNAEKSISQLTEKTEQTTVCQQDLNEKSLPMLMNYPS